MTLTAFKLAATGLAMALSVTGAQAQDWTPSGPINMMIAFRAGGGADSMGRLLAQELAETRGWEIIPQNVTGRGGANMAGELMDEPADGLAIGIVVDETFTYGIQATMNPSFGLGDFDYISTLTGTQMGIIARSDRGWNSLADVVAAAEDGEEISIGAMSPRLADAAYVIGQSIGVDFTAVMVQGGRGGLNGVVAEDLDLAWAAGPQTAGVLAGDLVNIVSAERQPLAASPDAQLLSEYDIPFTFGARFIVVAPDGLPEDVMATYTAAIAELLNDPESELNALVNRSFSGPLVIQGEDLRAEMEAGYESEGALLDASSQ